MNNKIDELITATNESTQTLNDIANLLQEYLENMQQIVKEMK